MRIRTKVWLLVALSVVLTAGIMSEVRIYAMRLALVKQSQDAANELADDIRQALERLDADVEDQQLALTLNDYVQGHPRIQRLELFVKSEAAQAAVHIEAPRGQRPVVDRSMLPFRQDEHSVFREKRSDDLFEIERPVELKGPWKATLVMSWDHGVETVIATTEKWSFVFAAVQLVALVLLAGLVIDRVVLRRLDVLATAMRDVERGDLERRVRVENTDEVGRLSQGFNRMLEQLSGADREIRAFSQRLAREIEAATQDLSKKNVALAQLNRLLNELRRENASKVRLATLGQLAAQLAHEIGTPLSSVSGHLQLALLQRELPGGLRERLEVATREIERIGRIVRDYLDSTRSLEPEKKPTSLAQVLEEAVEVTRGSEPSKGRHLEVKVVDDPSDFVTDPGLLRQIVINLLTNALDAVEDGGRVSLEARTADDDVLVVVRDTGSGISPEDLRRIFEPFYTTKGRGKGTGLGLAICRELTAALGGTISVESAPGNGSTFTVRLPRHGAPRRDESRPRIAIGGRA